MCVCVCVCVDMNNCERVKMCVRMCMHVCVVSHYIHLQANMITEQYIE